MKYGNPFAHAYSTYSKFIYCNGYPLLLLFFWIIVSLAFEDIFLGHGFDIVASACEKKLFILYKLLFAMTQILTGIANEMRSTPNLFLISLDELTFC